jgi:hypothetical protein
MCTAHLPIEDMLPREYMTAKMAILPVQSSGMDCAQCNQSTTSANAHKL